jgi:integrase
MHKQAVALLLGHFGETVTVESIDRGRASAFLSALIKQPDRNGKTPRSRATLRRIKSSLSSLWEWLIEGRPALENPWRGHGRKLKDERTGEEKRLAFSDEQLLQLLQGKPEQPAMADVIRIRMYSGMRLSEICDRKAGDVRNGAWHVTAATKKTPAAKRAVPIHASITDIVARRCKGKAPQAPLFPEIPRADKGAGTRAKTASKWFARYCDALKITDGRLVFHSLP